MGPRSDERGNYLAEHPLCELSRRFNGAALR